MAVTNLYISVCPCCVFFFNDFNFLLLILTGQDFLSMEMKTLESPCYRAWCKVRSGISYLDSYFLLDFRERKIFIWNSVTCYPDLKMTEWT
jgi:hypothetical protein